MPDQQRLNPILKTKLNRPRISRDHVYRARLIAELNLHRFRPLTLVLAPAGYGKSILISSWLESCDIPGGWLSLDRNDSNLRNFLSYFIAAVETIFPASCQNTREMLDAPDLPPTKILSSSLLNELYQIEKNFILVLDDYSLISETEVHNLLTDILEHPTQSIHLVIISRKDVPLPIARLRAQSAVTEIRPQELSFTIEETKTFLNQFLETPIDNTLAINLQRKTEGWVTGLRLAVISMKHRGVNEQTFLKSEVGGQYVMEYIFDEIFSRLPPEVTRYLMETAILDRFCGPVCDAVCAHDSDISVHRMSGSGFIDWLRKENMFLISLDSEDTWFRHHHLYRKLLVNQLKQKRSAEEIRTLHGRARDWFAENELIEETLQHALAAGDIEKAGSLLGRFGHDIMNNQQWPRLESLLGLLPRECVDQDPQLLLFEAWLFHIRFSGINILKLEKWLVKIEILFSSAEQKGSTSEAHLQGHFEALRGFLSFLSADCESALKHARAGCATIPDHHQRARVFAHIFQAGIYQMCGDLATGITLYAMEMERSAESRRDDYAMYLTNLNFIYWIDADLTALRQNAERSLKMALDSRRPEAITLSNYFLGIAYYHQNKLQRAEKTLTKIVEDYYFHHPVVFAHSTFSLALIYLNRGEINRAREIFDKLFNYAIEANDHDLHQLAQAFKAELSLRQGRLEEAYHWAKSFPAKPFLPQYLFYMPQLVLAKVLMSQDSEDSRQQATDLLDQLYVFFTSIHNNIFRIHVLTLQSLHYDSLGARSTALEKLTEALNLAEKGGFIRLFADLGPPMINLIQRLITKKSFVIFAEEILSAFKQDAYNKVADSSPHASSVWPSPSPPATVHYGDLLTNREIEVLELVKLEFSNKDIASRLFISKGTVKKHLTNIYRKLDVRNRRQACKKSVSLYIVV